MNNEVRVSVEFVEPPTMRGDEIGMVALVRVNYLLPAEQNERVPDLIEIMSDESGQYLKRELFRQGIEIADRELVLKLRTGKEGKGIQLFGTRRYTFKTRFGTVVVKRIRIRHKSDGSTQVPSAKVWATPRQVMVSRGLKNAVCNIVVKESFDSTRKQIERQTGEEGIISKSTIGNILHQEGGALAAAQQGRAEKVLNTDKQAKALLGRASAHIGENYFEAVYLDGAELESEQDAERVFEQIMWDPYQELIKQAEREQEKEPEQQGGQNNCVAVTDRDAESERIATCDVDSAREDCACAAIATAAAVLPKEEARAEVIAQLDEVVVPKQPGDKRERVVHYTGTIKTAARTYYCQGSTAAQLIYQVSGILATLDLHRGDKKLLVLSDCAGWINNWVNGIGIKEKEAIFCWWHLRERCRELVGEALTNKADRDEVRKKLLKYLWRGRTDKALGYLKKLIEDNEDGISRVGIKSIGKLETIKNYLIKRLIYIPDYQSRYKNKEWIASTQIEKFNDFSISARCKGKGQRWTSKGVSAIAALETAQRNGELAQWQLNNQLPSWASSVAA
jgi:hypothetical protein